MLTIARSELQQIVRNRMVFFSATIIPVGLSLLFIAQRDTFSQLPTGMGFLAGVFMVILISMGLYSTAVTTLAGVRQEDPGVFRATHRRVAKMIAGAWLGR